LLPHDIPRTRNITAVSAHYILHTYLGGPSAWPGRTAALTTDQQARLKPSASPEPPAHPAHPPLPLPLPLVDHRLVKALAIDGRGQLHRLGSSRRHLGVDHCASA
jgi:hypothetical protein